MSSGDSASNCRLYSQSHVSGVAFIRRRRASDMNLDVIQTVPRFKDVQTEGCTEVHDWIGTSKMSVTESKSL